MYTSFNFQNFLRKYMIHFLFMLYGLILHTLYGKSRACDMGIFNNNSYAN